MKGEKIEEEKEEKSRLWREKALEGRRGGSRLGQRELSGEERWKGNEETLRL